MFKKKFFNVFRFISKPGNVMPFVNRKSLEALHSPFHFAIGYNNYKHYLPVIEEFEFESDLLRIFQKQIPRTLARMGSIPLVNWRYILHRVPNTDNKDLSHCYRLCPRRIWYYSKSLLLFPMFILGLFSITMTIINIYNSRPIYLILNSNLSVIFFIGASFILLIFCSYFLWGKDVERNKIEDIQKILSQNIPNNNQNTVTNNLANINDIIKSLQTENDVQIMTVKLEKLNKLIHETEISLKRLRNEAKSPIPFWEKFFCCLGIPFCTRFNEEYKVQIGYTVDYIDAVIRGLEQIKQDTRDLLMEPESVEDFPSKQAIDVELTIPLCHPINGEKS